LIDRASRLRSFALGFLTLGLLSSARPTPVCAQPAAVPPAAPAAAPPIAPEAQPGSYGAPPAAPPWAPGLGPSGTLGPSGGWLSQPALPPTVALPPEPTMDPAVPGGAVLIASGVVAMVPGLIAFVVGNKETETCPGYWPPTAGACPTKEDFKTKQIGLTAFVGGTTSAVLGVAALAVSHDPDEFPASNVPMATSGLVLTGFGAASIVAGTASWIALVDKNSKGDQMMGGGVLAPFGVVALALGIPLWIEGAEPPTLDAPVGASPGAPWRPDELVYRSPPMMAAGIVLLVTGVAGAGLTVGLGYASTKTHHDDGLPEALASIYAGNASGVLLAAGGLLLGFGAAKVSPDEASARAEPRQQLSAPRVSIGPGSAQLDWRF
jgi:hypothetical protein